MLGLDKKESLYAAFDVFPTAKGAATHIKEMADVLFKTLPQGILYTLGNNFQEAQEEEDNILALRYPSDEPNYLKRAHLYSQHLKKVISQSPELKLIHYRDLWSAEGIPASDSYKKVFEVNSFLSIELPYRYKNLTPAFLSSIDEREIQAMNEADILIVPSLVIKENIEKKGIKTPIEVIPNGAYPDLVIEEVSDLPENYIIYFGALQPWQGIDTLLKALKSIRDLDLKLLICSSNRPSKTKSIRKLIDRWELNDQVIWRYELSKPELNYCISNAQLSIAPLSNCSRNVDQGCSPLKILESMACKTPVIASDLPVVREILDDNSGKLIQADRPQDLARAIRVLMEYPHLRMEMAELAYKKIVNELNWDFSKRKLKEVYSQIIPLLV